jgi:hypothetical protein
VHGVFDREEPLEQRTMLPILYFHQLRIYVRVRVGDVCDEERTLDGTAAASSAGPTERSRATSSKAR